MFHFQNLYLFFIASLLLNITPGNDMLYVASRSISQGIRAGIVSALGIFCGCFVHIMAAVLGLSIIIARSAYLFSVIKFAGAGYLIYLGIRSLLAKPNLNPNIENRPKANHWKLFKQGVVTNALNPKVAIFFLSFLPQFIDPQSSLFKIQLLTLGIWFAAQGTLVLIIVAIILGKTKDFFRKNPKVWQVQEKITGLILIGLGIKVALAAKNKMVDIETAKQIALSMPDTEEFDHFGRPAFKIKGKRTFATLWPVENRMMVKLSLVDQSVFHSFDATVFYPVPNKWGAKGATFIELSKVRPDMLQDAITTAWETALKK